MGLFDKRDKRKRERDEFESPVEQIDLDAATAAPEVPKASAATPSEAPSSQPSPAEPGEARVKPAVPATTPAAAPSPARALAKPAAPEPPEPGSPSPSSYGIDRAIELMRTLPSDNIELVVRVVKHTLESMQVKISDIITDATKKQEHIQKRLEALRGEITDFEKEITLRQKEIEELNADYKETNTVRKHLELAEKLCKNTKPAGNGKNSNKMRTNDAVSPARAGGAVGSSSSPGRPGKPMARPGNLPPVAPSSAKK